MLENKHLRSFLRVLDLGSFSRAARSLNIAQPALSQHVRKLEDQLGVVLLDRGPSGVTATHYGREFAEQARAILDLVDAAERRFKAGPDKLQGEVRVGMPGSVCPVLAPQLLASAQERHPGIKLLISESMSGDLAEMLRQGRMDIATLFNVDETDDFTSEPLVLETLHLIGKPRDPLFADETVEAERLVGLPLVGIQSPHGLRLLIEQWMVEKGISLNFEVEANAPSVLIDMAAQGMYYSLIARSAVQREIRNGSLASAEVTNPRIERTACLCVSKRLRMTRAHEAIVEITREASRQVVAAGGWIGSTL